MGKHVCEEKTGNRTRAAAAGVTEALLKSRSLSCSCPQEPQVLWMTHPAPSALSP